MLWVPALGLLRYISLPLEEGGLRPPPDSVVSVTEHLLHIRSGICEHSHEIAATRVWCQDPGVQAPPMRNLSNLGFRV